MNPVLDRIENTISRYNMIPPGASLGVAVSGGADSIFLLHILMRRGDVPLTVLHVNHGLRGAESDRDLAFVEELAAALGLPFVSHRMGPVSGNLEQFCRRERKAFFERVIAEGRVRRVATGHTASDQAETVLMRLLRGTGTTGLRGVLPVTAEGLVRPLLGIRREEIRAWLQTQAIPWREDASNASDVFLRNRVRSKLLPVMRELDPAVDSALERVAELAVLDEDYWRRETAAVLEDTGQWNRGGLVLDRRDLAKLHPALLGRVLRLGLELVFGGLRRVDRGHLTRVTELALAPRGEGAVEVPGGRIERSMDWVRIGGAQEVPAECVIPGELTGFGYTFRAWLDVPGSRTEQSMDLPRTEGKQEGPIEIAPPAEFTKSAHPFRTSLDDEGAYTEGEATVLDWERLRPPLRFRTWKAGDRFQPAGAAEAKLVKEFFERARIPSWDRRLWPMITDSDGIVWIYRFGAAARAVPHSATRRRLRVRCDTVSSK